MPSSTKYGRAVNRGRRCGLPRKNWLGKQEELARQSRRCSPHPGVLTWPVSRASTPGGRRAAAAGRSEGPRGRAGVQYLRLHVLLITMGTDSVWVVVPSLTHKVMLNDEFCGRPDGIAVTA